MSKTASALSSLKERFQPQSPPPPAAVKGVLREPEVVQRRSRPKEERVQKNLSILKRDADRLRRLARRDGHSQAVLLSLALDAYEQAQSEGDAEQ